MSHVTRFFTNAQDHFWKYLQNLMIWIYSNLFNKLTPFVAPYVNRSRLDDFWNFSVKTIRIKSFILIWRIVICGLKIIHENSCILSRLWCDFYYIIVQNFTERCDFTETGHVVIFWKHSRQYFQKFNELSKFKILIFFKLTTKKHD